MKILLIGLISIILISNYGFSQQAKYQTFKAKMKIIGMKDGEKMEWDNDNILVVLDYESGNFSTKLENTDFYLNDFKRTDTEDDIEERELLLKGILPIERIIDQIPINANYNFELEFITPDESYFLNFNTEITKPGSGENNYRIFIMRGIIYNDVTNFPAFKDYENEINIIIAFNAFSVR